MKQQKNRNMHNIFKVAGVLIFLILAFVIKMMLEEQEIEKEMKELPEERTVEYAETVNKDHPVAQVFLEKYPDAELLVACEEDVTNDGNKDLVVIYRKDGHVRMTTVMDDGDHKSYSFSEPIPAPVENQKIQFKNIDKEAEIEIIVTGEKKGAVGYAIYRIIDGQPVDLFGEGMEDCC